MEKMNERKIEHFLSLYYQEKSIFFNMGTNRKMSENCESRWLELFRMFFVAPTISCIIPLICLTLPLKDPK